MLKLNDKIFEYSHLYEGNEDILRELESYRNWIKHSSTVQKEEYEKKLKELNGAAEIAHYIYYTVRLCAQGLRRYIRHKRNGGVAVHHHEYQNDDHYGDHADDVVVMEEKRYERERDGGNHSADEYERHTLACRRFRFIGEIAEYRQKYERRQIVARHYDADHPLNVQYLIGRARFKLRGRQIVHLARKNIR